MNTYSEEKIYESYSSEVERMQKCIDELQQENQQLKEELEEYKNPIKYFKYANKNVTDENKQLKNNWEKLKEYIGAEYYCFDNESVEFDIAKDILNNIRDLEQGGDSNE